ncbi:MAG: AAA domain-containing protein [Deltaproteobacteria bacterium]|nr:AAA domain-containing protein [Deltaproteobacteria bacterium]
MEKTVIDGVTLYLAEPDRVPMRWVGQEELVTQIMAAWLVIDDEDLPLNPRLLGKPGVGKTTLAYHAGGVLNRPVYLFQATMDTRPEDLIVTPVISDKGKIKYVASSVVSAMINGGIAVIDEGNRMSEKSWASLAPLMDNRRYVESIVAGIKIRAHSDFRICTTMNDDASTFELPEYIHSRLQPQIHVDFPDRDEEKHILKSNLPFADEAILDYVVEFLQAAHELDERYSVRDGINMARYALKRISVDNKNPSDPVPRYLKEAAAMVLDHQAADFFAEMMEDRE